MKCANSLRNCHNVSSQLTQSWLQTAWDLCLKNHNMGSRRTCKHPHFQLLQTNTNMIFFVDIAVFFNPEKISKLIITAFSLSYSLILSLAALIFHALTVADTCKQTTWAHKYSHKPSEDWWLGGEGEQNSLRQHNFVWQEWQIQFYDWMGFSTLLGTHSPIMHLGTMIISPLRLAQRRRSI